MTSVDPEPRLHLEQRERLFRIPPPSFADDPVASDFARAAYAAAELRHHVPRSENPCALMPDTLAFLTELLERLAPTTIVEFGSGRSTEVFAQWASRNGAQLVSVEHDGRWVKHVEEALSPELRRSVSLVHSPLALRWAAGKMALTYRDLEDLRGSVEASMLMLLDGPHMSGREAVLRFVLRHAAAGATILLDDYNHYGVREMLAAVPPESSARFAGVALEENSHGLYVLRCLRPAIGEDHFRLVPVKDLLRSFWRCYLDHRTYRQDG